MSDTIAAIATALSPSAIGILRLSGPDTKAVLDAVFFPLNGRPMSQQTPRTMVLGRVLDGEGRVLDSALCVLFPGPDSYTGEDCAELHCHGSPVVLTEGLKLLLNHGARQAKGGEFTQRAFLNGRMDLMQAEAVVDVIDAETAQAARNAAGQLDGALSRTVQAVYDTLMDVTSRFYAIVDYPDEDIEDLNRTQLLDALGQSEASLAALLDTYSRGQVLKNGVPTVLLGKPNVGKSSLLNALVGYDRAIVTDVAGTTRDTVEESLLLGHVLLRLTDTAGIRETGDAVERLGVERSRKAAETADLVIAVVDGSQTPPTVDEDILSLSAQAPHWILAVSKNDLNPAAKTAVWQLPKELRDPDAFVSFSSVAPGGLDLLVDAVQSCFPAGTPADAGSLLTNARQESAVRRSLEAVRRALSALDSGLTPDAVLTDAEEALESIGELTGRTAKEEIVGAVFSRFCVGK